MSLWFSLLQSKIFSIVKNKFPNSVFISNYEIQKDSIDFVTTEKNLNEKPIFPTIKIRLLPMPELGYTLEGQKINGGYATIQVDVTTNRSEYEAQTLSFEVINILKSMMFEVIASPECKESDGGVYRSYSRMRRTICSDDVL